jgi:hypothetical protein
MNREADRNRAGTISNDAGRRPIAAGQFGEREAATATTDDLKAPGFRPADGGLAALPAERTLAPSPRP